MARKLLGRVQAEQKVNTILSESVLSLAQATDEIGLLTGYRPSRPTLCRWIQQGKLDSVRLGRQLFTSREAVHRYVVARTATIRVDG